MSSAQLDGIGRVIAFASARGGVGKSTLAVNLAIAAAHAGSKVGLLDADLNAPALHAMLGMKLRRRPPPDWSEPTAGPLGLRVVACDQIPDHESTPISFLEDELASPRSNGGQPAAMSYHQALGRLLTHTHWGALDLLLVDLNSGLEGLARFLEIEPRAAIMLAAHPSSGSARATAEMLAFLKANDVAVLGIVENMVGFNCDRCHSVRPLIPQGGLAAVAAAAQLPLLERLAFDPRLAETADHGTFFVREYADTPLAKQLLALARGLTLAPRLDRGTAPQSAAAAPQSSPVRPLASED